MNLPKLLVADDEFLIRKRILMMLGNKFDIDEAENAEQVLSRLDLYYHAVLMDITFPDGNGIDLCRIIKKKHPHRTVLISSSMETVDAWDKAFQAGADGYIEKRELLHIDPRKIELMVNNLIERNQLRKQTEELNHRYNELLSMISHDIRAPFQTLLSLIDVLKKDQVSGCAEQNIDLLHNCARDQLAFLNSLLELLRLESGAQLLRKMTLDIRHLVQTSAQNLMFLAKNKEIKVTCESYPDPLLSNVDPSRIVQVMNNLVTNAIKFTPRGGMIKIEFSRECINRIPGISIRVLDSGQGVPKSDSNKIFRKFHRGKYKGTEGERGTGLGLSISREIMQLHEGSLSLEDNPGNGAIFKIWLPESHSGQPSIAKKMVSFGMH